LRQSLRQFCASYWGSKKQLAHCWKVDISRETKGELSMSLDESHFGSEHVRELVERLGAILHGQPEAVQSAALADCTAMWIAGHFVPGDKATTASLRASLLRAHMKLVRDLVPINARSIAERWPAAVL
jgi:hypothetical protein